MNKYDIRWLIKTIKRILDHFQMYTHDIITDGMVGLRSTELTLKKITEESNLVTKAMRSSSYATHIQKLYRMAMQINREALRNILRAGRQYDMQFRKLSEPFGDDFLYSRRSLKNMKQLYEKGKLGVNFILYK